MSLGNAGHITQLLQAMGQGRGEGARELLEAVYRELRDIARQQMARERPGQTLQPTALVHEAYLKLLGPGSGAFENRAHFFAAAGEAMRRILVDQARRRDAQKRGGRLQRVDADDIPALAAPILGESVDLVALNDALSRLEEQDQRMADVVKLRFFTGLTVDETAAALDLSKRTVIRDWLAAKAWLFRELQAGAEGA